MANSLKPRRIVIYACIGISCAGLVLVLALLLLPSPYQGDKPLASECSHRLEVIGRAVLIYATEHNGTAPNHLSTLAEEGYLDRKYLQCPWVTSDAAYPKKVIRSRKLVCDYWYRKPDLPNSKWMSSEVVLASDLRGNHRGHNGNVLLGTGTVRTLVTNEEDEWYMRSPLAEEPPWNPRLLRDAPETTKPSGR